MTALLGSIVLQFGHVIRFSIDCSFLFISSKCRWRLNDTNADAASSFHADMNRPAARPISGPIGGGPSTLYQNIEIALPVVPILQRTLPGHIHQPGSVHLRHLGEASVPPGQVQKEPDE